MLSVLDEALLRILPTERDSQSWLSTSDALKRLQGRGHDVYPRLVLRHLNALQKNKFVISREEGRGLVWQRKPWLHGVRDGYGVMSASEAVAFNVLQRFAGNKLPEAVMQDIAPLFEAANIRLSQEKTDSRVYRAWSEKIDSVDGTFRLNRPPVNVEIFKAVALQEAYESGKLRGKQLINARRVIERRKTLGRTADRNMTSRSSGVTTSCLVRTYQHEVQRQKTMVRKAEFTQQRLLFVVGALRQLFEDENFINLLRAEGLATLPKYLAERVWATGSRT